MVPGKKANKHPKPEPKNKPKIILNPLIYNIYIVVEYHVFHDTSPHSLSYILSQPPNDGR